MPTNLFPACLIVLILAGAASAQTHLPLESEPTSAGLQGDYWQQPLNYNQTRLDRVVVDLGTIGLIRETPDDQVIAVDENAVPILNADSLQGSMQFGFKAMVDVLDVRPWFGGTDLQLGYFGINSLDAGARVSALEVNSVFFQAFPLNPPTAFDFSYSTNLYSGEANLRFGSRNRLRPIAGLRYLKLEDTYDVFESSSGSRTGFYSLTNNSLFGGQFGLEGDLWQTRRVNFYGFGKVGAMHNEVEGSATAQNAYKEFSDSTYTTLVDAGTGAIIRFAGPLSFKVGYRSLFASALALGIDQNEAISIFPGPNTVKFNSQHWHGVDLAAVFQF